MSASEATRIPVRTASKAYEVVVGTGLLDQLGPLVQEACGSAQAFVVTDGNVAPLYLEAALASLGSAGIAAGSHVFEPGEVHKHLGTYGGIVGAMADAGLTRDAVVVALGGGVTGDLAGFAAATYMRGIDVVQVPTSLLAMVDSSVGGKTGLDLHEGKNLVGAFLQPSLVVADVRTLATLTPTVFADGVGEIVKHAVLADPKLFADLTERPLSQGVGDDYLAQVVAHNVEIKRDVVATDERERGLRQTLNLGHTIGHAIEAASGYTLGHGHCVAAGLCCVARAASRLGWAPPQLATDIETCVAAQGLPTGTNIAPQQLYRQATFDKKRHGDTVNLVVPTAIGKVGMRRVSLEELADIIRLGCEKA